jgi:hypothetical protein
MGLAEGEMGGMMKKKAQVKLALEELDKPLCRMVLCKLVAEYRHYGKER